MQVISQTPIVTRFERFLAILAAVACLIITILIWRSVSAYQAMWLLPGLYFIEMVVLSVISTFMFVRSDPHAPFLTWGTAGVIGAFSILGALSVGFFYLPIALLFALISITSDLRNKRHITAHIGIFFMAGIMQSALMLAAV